ncbi:MAG: hypothetical protein FJ387_11045 [Verrucomicrobia bacterium]|nr:hypothetical protein [Verrucomicrobiota bacterium]
MFAPVDTKDPAAVEVEVQTAYLGMFPAGDRFFVPRAFGWVLDCFSGNYRDYQASDARYHDFEHTLQGTLCMARLLHRRRRAGATPPLTQRRFELGLLAILLHDTGYLKRRDDAAGTGAKFTFTHVARSTEFAARLLREKRYSTTDIQSVQNMIRCTGVNANLSAIPFQDDLERLVGFALGTADLLGQMAAADYPDKLPILYTEFAEAAAYSGDQTPPGSRFENAEQLMRGTPAFWEKYVSVKIEKDFGGLYRFLADPYPDGPNEYLERIQANVERVRRQPAPPK